MSEIKAIPTRYGGYHFRSRLEARWAVFFDELGVAYRYEEQGYEFGEGEKYLPDFRLPRAVVAIVGGGGADDLVVTEEVSPFVEIKPHGIPIPDGDLKRIIAFVRHVGETFVLVVRGDPLDMFMQAVAYTDETQYSVAPAAIIGTKGDACPIVAWQGRECSNEAWKSFVLGCASGFGKAAVSARSARFEHGESGAT